MYPHIVKPILDFIVALIALIIFSPIFIFILIVLLIIYSGSPFFIQERPGRNAAIFNLIKFKTMLDDKDQFGNLKPDKQRITWIGKILRSTSLDEIPQLINVIKSEMSLVGPRPLLKDYLSLYNPTQNRRHEVRPGVTGWAQVNGRNSITWEEKFKMDVWYVDHISFTLDMKILFLTLVKVLKKEGISSSNNATAEKFKGNLE